MSVTPTKVEIVNDYVTPSGIPVHIVCTGKNNFVLMSNGAIIDQEILNKWKIKKEIENAA